MTFRPENFVGVGVGSNFRRALYISKGLRLLTQCFGSLEISGLYKSSDASNEGPFYWNLAVTFRSRLNAINIESALKSIEIRCDRSNHSKDSGLVSLDLDILIIGPADRGSNWRINEDLDFCSDFYATLPLRELLPSHNFGDSDFRKYYNDVKVGHKEPRRLSVQWNRIL